MRRLFIIMFSLVLAAGLSGQEIPYIHSVDQFINNGLIINPAYTGSRGALSTTLMHRTQWLGFQGAPESQILTSHTPLKNDKVGLGLMIDNFSIPTVQYNSFYLNYAYRIWLGGTRLAFGLKAGGYLYKEKLNNLNLKDPASSDPAFTPKSGFAPNFGTGLYLYNDNYFLGAAVPFLMSQSDTATLNFDPDNYHFLFTAGYLLNFGPNFKIKPVALFDYNKFFISYQAAMHFILFKDALWLGSAYKSSRDMTFMAEIQISTALKIGYAYDHSFSDIAKFSNGSHEIMIRYELKYRANVDDTPYYF